MATDTAPNPGRLLAPVLTELADLVSMIEPKEFAAATPCTEFDVATLRSHILAWVQYFATALNDVEGSSERLDPNTYVAPEDPAEAAAVIRAAAGTISAAVADGVAERPVTMMGSPMPGSIILGMTLGEYLVHGSDLARATGRPWDPPIAATQAALDFMPTMLTDEYRGEGKSFGYRVDVAPDASALDQLLGLCGRDPLI